MAVTARGLVARRGRFTLDVDRFDADAGGTALLGRNGSGKTSLLLALQDRLRCEGVVERPPRCAGVFAQPAVLHGSTRWNVSAIARSAAGLDRNAADRRAEEVLTSVGLGEKLAQQARRLSSGERQRLALARALVLEPQALFLDEPFANVDADGRPILREVVREFVERSGCTLILATQNLADLGLCKSAVVLEAGRPVEVLRVSAINTSTDSYVQALLAESTGPMFRSR